MTILSPRDRDAVLAWLWRITDVLGAGIDIGILLRVAHLQIGDRVVTLTVSGTTIGNFQIPEDVPDVRAIEPYEQPTKS